MAKRKMTVRVKQRPTSMKQAMSAFRSVRRAKSGGSIPRPPTKKLR